VLAPQWGKGWFALLLGIVLAVMMVCYVAVPARIVGIPTTKPAGAAQSGRVAKLAGAAVTGLFGAIVCTPTYAIARGGIYLLGNHFALGVALLVIGLTLEAGATGAVKAIKVSLPVLPRLDLAAQRQRTMSRCQRRIVSGMTSSRSPCWRAFGITASRIARNAQSAQSSLGLRGRCRCRTVSWWRKIKISAVFHVSSRRASRSHAVSRVVRRNMNRRHMTGDHHGLMAERATLLVRAVDGILGTHTSGTTWWSIPHCP
jgi:hypothetical protein